MAPSTTQSTPRPDTASDVSRRRVLILHRGAGDETGRFSLLGRSVEVRRLGCHGSLERVRDLVAAHDGEVDAIALEGMPVVLELGRVRRRHRVGADLAAASRTPVVDGAGVRGAAERWAVQAVARAEPGIFSHKRTVLVPGLNHGGLAEALERFGARVQYADPAIFFGLPDLPGVGHRRTLSAVAAPTLDRLRSAAFDRLHPLPGASPDERSPRRGGPRAAPRPGAGR